MGLNKLICNEFAITKFLLWKKIYQKRLKFLKKLLKFNEHFKFLIIDNSTSLNDINSYINNDAAFSLKFW